MMTMLPLVMYYSNNLINSFCPVRPFSEPRLSLWRTRCEYWKCVVLRLPNRQPPTERHQQCERLPFGMDYGLPDENAKIQDQ
ncbi:hypothetical protein EJB05_49437, partial [Eragrostis curvula]